MKLCLYYIMKDETFDLFKDNVLPLIKLMPDVSVLFLCTEQDRDMIDVREREFYQFSISRQMAFVRSGNTVIVDGAFSYTAARNLSLLAANSQFAADVYVAMDMDMIPNIGAIIHVGETLITNKKIAASSRIHLGKNESRIVRIHTNKINTCPWINQIHEALDVPNEDTIFVDVLTLLHQPDLSQAGQRDNRRFDIALKQFVKKPNNDHYHLLMVEGLRHHKNWPVLHQQSLRFEVLESMRGIPNTDPENFGSELTGTVVMSLAWIEIHSPERGTIGIRRLVNHLKIGQPYSQGLVWMFLYALKLQPDSVNLPVVQEGLKIIKDIASAGLKNYKTIIFETSTYGFLGGSNLDQQIDIFSNSFFRELLTPSDIEYADNWLSDVKYMTGYGIK